MDVLPSFGRYEALFRLAAGGMAEVFAARIRGEAGFEKLVAVKRMLPHIAEDEHFVDMFLDEAKLAVHVSSPHVVQTLDLGRAGDGALYIVMELVVGCALSALVREQRKNNTRVPIPIAVEIAAQAAQGLDDAHEAVTPTGLHLGIVHRDVSPQNILVGVDGRARVTDFGIARAMLRRTSTQAGELKGKFAYFSPEQAHGRTVDRRSDVFALGIVAWESFMGRRLFSGDDSFQILAKVKEERIPLLHEIDDAVPREVSLAIARALARDPDERFATAADFATALREAGRVLGPQPTAREIGRWVGDAGGEPLQRVRAMIDKALAGDDLPTVDLALAGPRSGSQRSRPSLPDASHLAVEPAPVDEATLASFAAEATGRGKRRVAVATVALIAIGGAGALVWTSQQASSTSAHEGGAETETAPFASGLANAAGTTEPHAAASAEPTASTAPSTTAAKLAPPKAWPKTKPAAAPPTSTAKPTTTAVAAPEPAKTAEPAPASTPAPTQTEAPPQPTAAPTTKKNGPLLGDDAFEKMK